jgi:hypothetical protein
LSPAIRLRRQNDWLFILPIFIKLIIFLFVTLSQDTPFFATDNATRGDITRHDGTHTNYGAITYFCAWHDTHVHPNPDVSTNDHWFEFKAIVVWKTSSTITMVGCVEGKIPAYMTIVAYPQSAFALYPGIIPYVHVIAYHYILWRANYYSAVETNPLATSGESRH